MTTRPSFPEIYMGLARNLAARSTCLRRSVGAVLATVDGRRVLAVGYNGNASGLPNKCDREAESGNCGCLHAEDNMVINCDSPRAIEKIAYVTTQPCAMCAKRLINLGNVKKVYYADAYHNTDGIDILRQAGIEVEHLDVPAPQSPKAHEQRKLQTQKKAQAQRTQAKRAQTKKKGDGRSRKR